MVEFVLVSPARFKVSWRLLPLALPVLGGCATTATARLVAPAEQERALLDLRAKNAGYVRQIEELENRIFILEDQLDSRNLAAEQKAPAVLPTRREQPEPQGSAPRPAGAEDNPASAGETSIVAEHSVDYTGDAVETSGAKASVTAPPAGAPTARPVLRLSAAATGKDRTARVMEATAAPEPGATTMGSLAPALARDPLPAYRQALEILRAGQPAQALPGFRRFLDEHPQHDYADNAQYWIGECHYAQKQYRPAERAFRSVVETYPRGNKVPDAMLKLGFTLQAVGDQAQGHAVLESLTRAFPKHQAARLASERLAHPESTPAALGKPTTFGTVLPPQAPGVPARRAPAAVNASPTTGKR